MSDADQHVWAVIMAGGSGTRFWPVSKGSTPKQLTAIVGESTMIQATVARLQPAIPAERVLVITTAAIAEETRKQLPMIPAANIIAEPIGRDTAPCVCLAAQVVHRLDPDGIMHLLAADHLIEPADRFQATLAAGAEVAREQGKLVTYGIEPRYPATGYGYIKLADEASAVDGIAVNPVERFVEKPDSETAEGYLADGGYRWNSGIFTWRADVVIQELKRHVGWLTDALGPVSDAFGTEGFANVLDQAYPGLDKISIDYALMEHAEGIACVTADFQWDDVGSWDALYDHIAADAQGVRTRGDVIAENCRDSLFVTEHGPVIAAVGLEGMTVVSTPEAVLVVPRGDSQAVKELYQRIKESRPELT